METVKKLRRTFQQLGGLGPTVQVRQASENVKSVAESDVVLLWSVASVVLGAWHSQTLNDGVLIIYVLQLQTSIGRTPVARTGHVASARGQTVDLNPGRHDNLDDARMGARLVHGRQEYAQHAFKGASPECRYSYTARNFV